MVRLYILFKSGDITHQDAVMEQGLSVLRVLVLH
jgi:hypothetical protein